MRNLLEETLDILKENNKSMKDVCWIGSDSVQISIEDFVDKANIEYDDGYGNSVIIEDLMVVGNDFWLERGEYGGSEWWEYKTMPKRPDKIISIETLCTSYLLLGTLDKLEI